MPAKDQKSAADTEASAMEPHCFFFKPPPEIRVCIYEYAFAPDTTNDPVKYGELEHDGDCSNFSCVTRSNWRTRSGLPQVCRTIRHEATPTFYNSTTFHLCINKLNYIASTEWLDEIGKAQARLIPKLIISWEPSARALGKLLAIKSALKEASDLAHQRQSALHINGQTQYFPHSSFWQTPVDKASMDLYDKLSKAETSDSAIQADFASALGHAITSPGINLDSVVIDEASFDDDEEPEASLRYIQRAFMTSLKWTLFPERETDNLMQSLEGG